jgi:hypothetical protein
MSVSIIAMFLYLLGATPSVAQSLYPICRESKWGYANDSGDAMIRPQFERASDFHEGLARVVSRGRLSFISPSGKVVFSLPEDATAAGNFSEGLAWFKAERYGYIDRDGRVVIRPQFSNAGDFHNGLAPACKTVAEQPAACAQWGYIQKSGAWMITFRYRHATSFSEGVANVVDLNGVEQFYVNAKGNRVFDISLDKGWRLLALGPFSEGKALIGVSDEDGKSRYGYLDHFGKVSVLSSFSGGRDFCEGYAIVLSSGNVQVLNSVGDVAFKTPFTEAGDFHEGMCRVQEVNGAWAYIGLAGEIAINKAIGDEWSHGIEFNDCMDFAGGTARVHIGGQFEGA